MVTISLWPTLAPAPVADVAGVAGVSVVGDVADARPRNELEQRMNSP